MVMPTWEQILLPLLKFCSDKKEHSNNEAIEKLTREFNLTPEETSEKLHSGQFKFVNRIGWAKTALTKASLLEVPRRSYMKITDEGMKLLNMGIKEINYEYLYKNYPTYARWQDDLYNRYKEKKNKREPLETGVEESTPQEVLDEQYRLLRNNLAEELLDRLKKVTPTEFEKIVLDLLKRLDYGEEIEHTGQTGDGGIDGIIKQDKLGLDSVYVQAKRWTTGSVGSPDINQFYGALEGKGATKGVFITTSRFSEDAEKRADSLKTKKIILIDGKRLANLMIDNDVGVSMITDYKIKRLDEDYFSSID